MSNHIDGTTVEDFLHQKFDFVVVGGGTAGLALATRLSENAGITVGVLECGGSARGDDAVDIPGNYGLTFGTKYDWNFTTVPQKGLGGRIVHFPRGKVLGGTSALNFMTWNRPNKEDFDAWRDLGDAGWGWDEILPYFMKSETFQPPAAEDQEKHKLYYDPSVLGAAGPLRISYGREHAQTHQFWHGTLNNLGVETNVAHVGGSNVGVWTNLGTVDLETQTRSYSYSAYYLPNAHRRNLTILTDALVEEVVLNKSETGDWVAQGVKFSHGGADYVVNVSREVILAAGSIQSPQLLELSGIGDSNILQVAGIDVKVHNPNVGENLQDHLMHATIFEIDSTLKDPDEHKYNEAAAEKAREQYFNSKSGPLTILPCSLCYLHTSQILEDKSYLRLCHKVNSLQLDCPPDELAIRKSRFFSPPRLGQLEFVLHIGNWNQNFRPHPDDGKLYATLLTMLQYPFSKGSVHIKPAVEGMKPSLLNPPQIDPKYLEDEGSLDEELLAYGVGFADQISKTSPIAGIIRGRAYPGPSIEVNWISDELRNWVTQNTTSDFHPVGTCAMGGKYGISRGVVDERLRVYGVKGLRVIDASIMPLQISAHLQATVYAIAEKGAAMVLEDFFHSRAT